MDGRCHCEGAHTPGAIGTMDPATASQIHAKTDFQSHMIMHASSDAVPHANGYLGLSVTVRVGQEEMIHEFHHPRWRK